MVHVDPSHNFRYPSESDPRKHSSISKGGYLEGHIKLPSLENCSEMKLRISTCAPVEDILGEFHPNMLHVARWKGKDRDRGKETVPDPSHWMTDFIVRTEGNKRKLYINNSRGDNDHDRLVQDEDFLFEFQDTIHLGKGNKKLSLIILHPKKDQRSSEADISLSKVLEKRIADDDQRKVIKEKYLKDGLSSVKLKVEVLADLMSTASSPGHQWQTQCYSGVIVNKSDKTVGSLDIKYVKPSISCSRGNREMMIVTEQPAKDVTPVLQCHHLGQRDRDAEKHLQQPDPRLVVIDNQYVTRFRAPAQPNIDKILNNGFTVKVFLQQKNGTYSYSGHDIIYKAHNTASECSLCNVEEFDGLTQSSLLPSKTAPGRKRRLATQDSSDQKPGHSKSERFTITLDHVEETSFNIDSLDEAWNMETLASTQTLDHYSSTLNTPDPEPQEDSASYYFFMPPPSDIPPKELFQVDGRSPKSSLDELRGLDKAQILPRSIRDVNRQPTQQLQQSISQRIKSFIIGRIFKDDPNALEIFSNISNPSIQEKLDVIFNHFAHLPVLIILIMSVFYLFPEMVTFVNCVFLLLCFVIPHIL